MVRSARRVSDEHASTTQRHRDCSAYGSPSATSNAF